MASEIRFHLDECGDARIARGLRRRGIDVSIAAEVGLLAKADSAHLLFATGAGRVLVSPDSDYLVLAGPGAHHAGIFRYRPDRDPLGEVIENLVQLHARMSAEEMVDRIEFFHPIDPLRRRAR